MNSSYEISRHPLTGDVMWIINDVDLVSTDAGKSIVKKFISEYYNNEYTLSIYDSLSGKNIEIKCAVEEIPNVVADIYYFEHANFNFIGLNSFSDSYVVGMELTKGRFTPGFYRLKDNKLVKVE